MKRRNPSWGCPRIAQQIALAFGVEIDKDVVRRILSAHYRPESDSAGPSWLTFLGHMKDSLWSYDLFRCESAPSQVAGAARPPKALEFEIQRRWQSCLRVWAKSPTARIRLATSPGHFTLSCIPDWVLAFPDQAEQRYERRVFAGPSVPLQSRRASAVPTVP